MGGVHLEKSVICSQYTFSFIRWPGDISCNHPAEACQEIYILLDSSVLPLTSVINACDMHVQKNPIISAMLID